MDGQIGMHDSRQSPRRGLGPVDWSFVRRAILPALSLGGVIVFAQAFSVPGPGFDFFAYWSVDPAHPYTTFEGFGAFRYAPPLVWIAGPLKLLPFGVAYWFWFAGMFAILIALTRRWALAWLMFPPVTSELFHGNVHLLLAGALVWGFRWPALWALLPLAKVTTGLPLLWAALRLDRRLVVVGGVFAVIGIATEIVLPGAWSAWIARLLEPSEARLVDGGGAQLAAPLLPRLVVAVAIVVWAAAKGRRWPLAVVLVLSLPQLWFHGISMLVAIPALVRQEAALRGSPADPDLDRPA